ncbi:GNAT family N-acetyltransferase [Arthrobacter pigmenti]
MISVRRTGPADFATLRRLFDDDSFSAWRGSGITDAEIRAKYLGARSPDVDCFLVMDANEVVGFTQLHVADADAGDGGGMDLALLATAQGRGFGRAVVHQMARRAKWEKGWRRFTVDPDITNTAGIAFWTKVPHSDGLTRNGFSQ